MSDRSTRAGVVATEAPATRDVGPERRRPRSARRRGVAPLVVVLLVGAAVGYLLGYEEYSSRSTKAITPAACAAAASGAGTTRFSGTVRSSDGRTLVVEGASRAGVAVALDAASICRQVGARTDDLRRGQRVTVVGTRGADGTVSAAQIVVTSETRGSPG
ncbi:MAG TPA: hypothetical protein VIB48_22260 [Acidimicrobiia bacterium]|jgi:hypothetical protein